MSNMVLQRSIEQRRLRLLFSQAEAASVIGLCGAVVCAVMFLYPGFSWPPVIWLSAVLLGTALRFALYRRFFGTDILDHPARRWLMLHASTAVLVGIAWGSLPLLQTMSGQVVLRELQILIPAFVLMGAITSYGVYLQQYLVLLAAVGLTTLLSVLIAQGPAGIPEALLFGLLLPLLVLTARRYAQVVQESLESQLRAQRLVHQLTIANEELHEHNAVMDQQRDLIEQEEALAKHVFRQLMIGGDLRLPGIHTWNQALGSLSGDLTQTAQGPQGQGYVFLGDFTGHGLPAALGAVPASSVFLAMAAKGIPVESIAEELNAKLRQLLPVGYFCCAVLLEISADRSRVNIWNGGLPPVLIQRHASSTYDKIHSHSVPLGVLSPGEFRAQACSTRLAPGDLLYAFTDGLTEAQNSAGEMWGLARLESFLGRADVPPPRLPTLIEAVLRHVDKAPASDDISVVEIEASPAAMRGADAA